MMLLLMRFRVFLLFIILLLTCQMQAQSTTVSGTLVDSNGIVWSNANIQITFQQTAGVSGPFCWNGNCTDSWKGPYNLVTDGVGHFSQVLPTNVQWITPAGSNWIFNIAPNANSNSAVFPLALSTSSLNISSLFTNNAPIIKVQSMPVPRTYTSTYLTQPPNAGQLAYDTTNNNYIFWNGSAWTVLGGGGGGVTPVGGFAEYQAKNNASSLLPTGMFGNASAQNRYTNDTNSVINPLTGTYVSNYNGCNWFNPLIGHSIGDIYSIDCLTSISTVALPGYDIGAGWGDLGLNAFELVSHMTSVLFDFSRSVSTALAVQSTKTGVSDSKPIDAVNNNYYGPIGDSDEAAEILRLSNTGAQFAFGGTITSLGTSSIFVGTCVFDCSAQGDGRYIMRTTPDIAANIHISAVVPGVVGKGTKITIPEGIPPGDVSTSWCDLVNDVPTPPKDISPFTTSMTFDCQIPSIAPIPGGVPVFNGHLSFEGNFHDTGNITAVVPKGGGLYTITAAISQPHRAGSRVYQGFGYMAVSLDLNVLQAFSEFVPHPFECAGATDIHTLYCEQFFTGLTSWLGLGYANVGSVALAGFMTMHNDGAGHVIINNFGNNPIYNNQATVYFSGSTPSTYNGPCTNATVASNTLTCNQASSSGSGAVTVLPSIAIGTTADGSATGGIYGIAQVYDVRNQSTWAVDGTFVLEANNMALGINDDIYELQGMAGAPTGIHMGMSARHPFIREASGMLTILTGDLGLAGTSGDANGLANAVMTIFIQPDLTKLIGLGGINYPASGFSFRNVLRDAIVLGVAPYPSGGGNFAFIGCPLQDVGGCENPTYNWNLFSIKEGSAGLGFAGTVTINNYLGTWSFFNFLVQIDQPTNITIGGQLICLANGVNCPGTVSLQFKTTFTSSGAITDSVIVGGLVGTEHCSAQQTAGSITAGLMVNAAAGQVNLSGITATAGLVYSIFCD